MKFMSDNGLVFDKMEDCQAFEADPSFRMFNDDGEAVQHGDLAILVEIRTENGYTLCQKLFEQQGSSDDGLGDDPGFYYWGADGYEYISYEAAEALKAVFKARQSQEKRPHDKRVVFLLYVFRRNTSK